ncbi:DUF4412 domain-containing protein [Membranihabitans marinus]|uniref:DUF4412 domain-containing protein n=1 Tax=Membranihabitans marinus TaxID=1227546 RepID=UPI001F310611|nr:DUF4412 domain-containing protein [Membranihabitans marinus]
MTGFKLKNLFTLLFIGISTLVFSQKSFDEATLQWAVTKSNATTDQGAQAVEMIKDLEVKWTFDENNLAGSMNMGSMMTTKYFLNKEEDYRKIYMVMMGQKYQANLDPEQFERIAAGMQSFSDQSFELDPSDTKKILGYDCQAVVGKISQNGQHGDLKVYVTNDIEFKGSLSQFISTDIIDKDGNTIKGFPLSVETIFPGFGYTLQIIELKNNIDREMLKEPKSSEYKTMNPSMLKQLTGQ